MIDLLFQITLNNISISLVLAIIAAVVGKIVKRPMITHLLWLLVFLKLLAPPVFMVPAIPMPWVNESNPPVNLTTNEQQGIQTGGIIDSTYLSSETGHMMFIQGKHWLFLVWLSGSIVVLISSGLHGPLDRMAGLYLILVESCDMVVASQLASQ